MRLSTLSSRRLVPNLDARALCRAAAALPRIDPSILTEPTIRTFQEDGAVMLAGAVPNAWLDVLCEAAEANLANPGPLCDEHAAAAGTGGRFHDDQFLWHRHSAFEEYVLRSGVGALAARAMRWLSSLSTTSTRFCQARTVLHCSFQFTTRPNMYSGRVKRLYS